MDDRGVETSDEELCRHIAAGDRAAFEQLVERHQERAYRVAWSVLGDAEEARDLSQEAFLRVFEKAASFDGRSRFTTWFHRILVNLCLDHRRGTRRWWWARGYREDDPAARGVLEPSSSPEDDPSVAVGRSETMNRLRYAARGLSARQRAVLTLQLEEDLSTRDIARVLGCAEATVRVHLHRALTALRLAMGSE